MGLRSSIREGASSIWQGAKPQVERAINNFPGSESLARVIMETLDVAREVEGLFKKNPKYPENVTTDRAAYEAAVESGKKGYIFRAISGVPHEGFRGRDGVAENNLFYHNPYPTLEEVSKVLTNLYEKEGFVILLENDIWPENEKLRNEHPADPNDWDSLLGHALCYENEKSGMKDIILPQLIENINQDLQTSDVILYAHSFGAKLIVEALSSGEINKPAGRRIIIIGMAPALGSKIPAGMKDMTEELKDACELSDATFLSIMGLDMLGEIPRDLGSIPNLVTQKIRPRLLEIGILGHSTIASHPEMRKRLATFLKRHLADDRPADPSDSNAEATTTEEEAEEEEKIAA